MEHNKLQSKTQSNLSYNAPFAPNTPPNIGHQQEAQAQAGPVPPLGNASDLSSNPSARNLQTYNTTCTPQGVIDSWTWHEYQPIKPGEPHMQKLADEAENTKKLERLLRHAREDEEAGDFQDAEKAYKQALKFTENAEHYKLYAACLKNLSVSLKDEAKERTYREKASRAFYHLGELYTKQGALHEAQTAYRASCDLALYELPLKALVAVARQLEDTAEISNALEKLADFYAGKGRIDLAIDKLEAAFRVLPAASLLEKLEGLYSQGDGEDRQPKVNKADILRFELQIRTLEQKLVKRKTKTRDLKGQIKTLGEKVEFLEKQIINLDFSIWPDIKNSDLISLISLLTKKPQVKSLNLEGCTYLTDAVLHILPEYFENLQELNLRGCKGITEAGLNGIAETASQLKRLTLDHCPGTTIKLLHKLNAKGIDFTIKGLTFKKNVLRLPYSAKDEELWKALETNPETTELSLSDCTIITDAGLVPLKNFPWLTSLNLRGCTQLTDAGLKNLSGLTQLTSLDLGNCTQLTGAGLHHLEGLTKLTSLNLNYYNHGKLTDADLQYVEGLTQLTSLDLSSCTQFTGSGLQYLKGLAQLTSLNLRSCDNLTDADLHHLAGLTQLRSLNLDHCRQFRDASLQYLAGLIQLRSLNLNGCCFLTGACLQHLRGLKQLTSLNLNGCCSITDSGLQHLTGLTQLRSLDLDISYRLTDAHLKPIASLTQLTTLNLSSCNNITNGAKEQLKKQIPGLTVY